ncbi:hypothetical protein AQ908_09400 [Burkholderia pseudomallei]|nr:hypothetical protein AQ874_25460 [Burkholderia pseudomallei]ONC03837.1 hypothetical protein AQ908_09400 [Burkholderia pseudomallei]
MDIFKLSLYAAQLLSVSTDSPLQGIALFPEGILIELNSTNFATHANCLLLNLSETSFRLPTFDGTACRVS